MERTILVPIDFSGNSKDSFNYATELAVLAKAGICLYHAWDAPIVEQEFSAAARHKAYDRDQNKKFSQLEALAAKAEARGVKCTIRMEDNYFIDGLLSLCEELNPFLVVIGNKGAGKIESFFVGSKASKVIDKVTEPVLLIPAGAKFKGLKKIMFAIDYHAGNINDFHFIGRFAMPETSYYLHISTDDERSKADQLDELKKIASGIKQKVKGKAEYIDITDDDIIEGIETALKKHKPDLLVMVRTKKTMLEKFFWGSLTKRMAFVTKQPFLVIHGK